MDDLIPVFFPLVVSRLVHGGRGSRRRTSEQTSVGDRLSESQLYCDINYVINDIARMLVTPFPRAAEKWKCFGAAWLAKKMPFVLKMGWSYHF